MEQSEWDQRGVHRGKQDQGRYGMLHNIASNYGIDPDSFIMEGSQADGCRGSRLTDLDISAHAPIGLNSDQLALLERRIQDETGIDFYFRNF